MAISSPWNSAGFLALRTEGVEVEGTETVAVSVTDVIVAAAGVPVTAGDPLPVTGDVTGIGSEMTSISTTDPGVEVTMTPMACRHVVPLAQIHMAFLQGVWEDFLLPQGVPLLILGWEECRLQWGRVEGG